LSLSNIEELSKYHNVISLNSFNQKNLKNRIIDLVELGNNKKEILQLFLSD
jgi:hypothetical protein